ncbi:MAG: hypothetical protein KDD73_15895 [Anaerolineales bacterium]|nr:hypothetical protein [Anaerolineales bacterium]MCB9128777.1 hypothetical protein [Ardenticatenales bacterium]
MEALIDFVFQTLLGELIVVVVGVLFANFIRNRWDEWRFGGWRVIVTDGAQSLVDRVVSAHKAKEVLGESADLSVFLKGIVSPYAHLRCDLVDEGVQLGLLKVDHKRRRFMIDLRKNPAQNPQQPRTSVTL